MRRSEHRPATPAAETLVVGFALSVILSGAGGAAAEERTSGTEHWQGRRISYELSGRTDSDIRFSREAGRCRITLTTDGVVRTVILEDEDVEVDGEGLDVGRYDSVALNAGRDSLIVNLVNTRSWSARTSGSASGRAATDGSATGSQARSRSASSGTSTDHHAFGFTELGNAKIRVRLRGGRAAECAITGGTDERVVRFDVDGGKNRGTIAVRPGLMSIDGADRTIDRGARLLVTATRTSLSITADGTEVWSRD